MKPDRLLLLTGVLVTGLVGCQQKENNSVGGVWGAGTPDEGEKVTETTLHLTAHAHPTDEDDPEIDRVEFTAYYPGARSPDPEDSDAWAILCTDTKPDSGTDIYRCDADITNVPPGNVTISFDVYNVNDEENLAPNGTRTFEFNPEN